MNRIFLFLILSLLVAPASLFAKPDPNYPDDLAQLHQNILNELLGGPLGTDTLQALVDRMDEHSAWANIPYQSKQRGSWEPALHLSYVQTMAKAWRIPGSDFYNNPKLLAKIHLALNYWLDDDFQCPNWWYPEIGVPKQLAPILILMEDQLSPEQMAKGIKILDRSKIGMTGQNKVWQSGNVLLKSLLQRNAEMSILRNYLIDGQQWITWKNQMDISASGYRIKSNFVGGVSDGKTGVAAMDYNRNGLSAKKAWFILTTRLFALVLESLLNQVFR